MDDKNANFIYDEFDAEFKAADSADPSDDKRINDAWNFIIKYALEEKWNECADACMRLNDTITPKFQIEIDSEKYARYQQPKYKSEKDDECYTLRVCVTGKCDALPILHANCWRIAKFNGQGCDQYDSIRQPDGTFDTANCGIFPEPPNGTGLARWCFDVVCKLAEHLGNWHLQKLTQELLEETDYED